MKQQRLEITESDANLRLDIFLTDQLRDLSRSHIQKLIATHSIRINGGPAKPGYKTQEGDSVEVDLPAAVPLTQALPEPIALNVVYEDEDLIVINKAKGMVVHPAPGAETGTLVNALIHHCQDLSGIGGVLRPGIVHRLDKDTSGLLVVAKNDQAHRNLAQQIKTRTATRKYQALLWGRVPFKHAVIDAPIARHPADRKRMTVYEDIDASPPVNPRRPLDLRLPHGPMMSLTGEAVDGEDAVSGFSFGKIPNSGGARQAITEIRLLEHLGIFSWVEAILQTGRTHQIRVHMAFAGYPVVGDVIYGGMRRVSADELRGQGLQHLNDLVTKLHGQALHAYSLAFTHPRTGQRMQFHAALPQEVGDLVDYLRRIEERS